MYLSKERCAESIKDKDRPSIDDVMDSLRDLDSSIEEIVNRNNTPSRTLNNSVRDPSQAD